VLANYGWSAVNQVTFPAILGAAALLVWFGVRNRTKLA
jgi:hypothetical protein